MLALLERFDERERNMIAGGVLLLVLAALITYAIAPKWKAYRAARQSCLILENVTSEGDELQEQLVRRSEAVAELRRSWHGDMANLPLQQMEGFVIGRLQNISWRHEIELVSVQPDEGTPVETFRELLFEVELAGDYFGLHRWLWDIRDELGFIVVKELEIRRIGREAGAPRLQAMLTLASYRGDR